MDNVTEEIKECKSCSLHKSRKNVVPGEGSLSDRILFIGEGPGADEDEQGRPFVGRAGQLLTKIIESVGFERGSIYITNVVKCRPPENRNPKDKEIAACFSFLESQIAILNPRVIVTVGSIATKTLISELLNGEGITKIRGRVYNWMGIKVIPILHPSYLLRNPSLEEGRPKWQTWQDMLLIKKEYDSGRT